VCLLSLDLMEQCIYVDWFDLKWWNLLMLLDFFGFLLWVSPLFFFHFIYGFRLKLSNSIQKNHFKKVGSGRVNELPDY